MKKALLLLGLNGFSLLAAAQAIGPSTLNAAGGSATAAGDTYEWSVGEMALVSTYSGPGLVVTQGILQPRAATTGIGSTARNITGLKVYPNPVTDGQLYLSPAFRSGGTLTYRLTDAAGKTVLTQSTALLTGKELQAVNISTFANGEYILSVSWQDGKETAAGNYHIQKLR